MDRVEAMSNDALLRCLESTLSSNCQVRKDAESMLLNSESTPDFVSTMFNVVCHKDIATNARLAAVLALKNCLRRRWAAEEGSTLQLISSENRQFIKSHIWPAMLSCEPIIQRQIIEAIVVISAHDFPDDWPQVVDLMKEQFSTKNYEVLNATLSTAKKLFKHFETEMKSKKLWTEIKFVLDSMADDLTKLMESLMNDLKEASANWDSTLSSRMQQLLTSVLLICEIFYSLNVQDLPEFFEDNIITWMNTFVQLLELNSAKLGKSYSATNTDVLERVKAQVIHNITLYAQNYKDEFDSFAPAFVSLVWTLLFNASLAEKNDTLVINGLRFLSSAVVKKPWNEPFAAGSLIQQTCHDIILRNMELRSCDVDLLDSSPEDFAEQDFSCSDFETRRRGAREFVRALCANFESEVMFILSEQVGKLVGAYQSNPDMNWMQMDAAICLVIAIGSRGHTSKLGVTKVAEQFEPSAFFEAVLNEELKSDAGISILKADVLKYLITFRGVFDKQLMLNYLPGVVRFLVHQSPLVRMYSAHLLECLLTTKDGNAPSKRLYTNEELAPHLSKAMESLIMCFGMEETEECVYIARCVQQLLFAYQDKMSAEMLATLFQLFHGKLVKVMKNPLKAQFNHCLFEVLCLLLQIVCRQDANAFGQMESILLAPIQEILVKDLSDFVPYVFQLLSLMLNLRVGSATSIPEPYRLFYPFLMVDQLWQRTGYIPAMVRLLQAYFRLGGPTLLNENDFAPVLSVFNRLVQMKSQDQNGVELMSTVVQSVPGESFRPYVETTLKNALSRLHSARTEKFSGLFVNYFCLLLHSQSPAVVADTLERMQSGLFAMVLEKIVLPQLATVPKKMQDIENRLRGLLALLVDYAPVISGQYRLLWNPLAMGMMELFNRNRIIGNEEEAESTMTMCEITQDFDAVYSLLVHSELKSVKSSHQIATLVSAGMRRLSLEQPDAFALIEKEAPPELKEKLKQCIEFQG